MGILSKLGGMAAGAVAAAALLIPGTARAQLDASTSLGGADANWTATAGQTVGTGNAVLHAEAGWPGVGFTYLKGMNESTDLGFHIGFNYGLEGTTNGLAGVNLAVPYRRLLGRSGDTTLAFRTDPGVSFYSDAGLRVGVGGPLGLVAGLKVDPRLTLDLGADVNTLVSFTNSAGVLFGPQFGGGAEFLIDQNLAVTARLRAGPEFLLTSHGSSSQVGVTGLIGLAYNAR